MILSAAMMLRFDLALSKEADLLEAAVDKVLNDYRTADIYQDGSGLSNLPFLPPARVHVQTNDLDSVIACRTGQKLVGCIEMGNAVSGAVAELAGH